MTRASQTREIDIATIIVPERLRPVDEAWVSVIAESMRVIGLQEPVTVNCPDQMRVPDVPDTVELVSGAHRLAAARALGWRRIAARVTAVDRRQARLMEIDENLMRRELSALDRAVCLAERQEVWQELYPETRGGVAGGLARHRQGIDNTSVSAMANLGHCCFAADVAERTGFGARTIRRLVLIGRQVAPEVRARIALTWLADHQQQLEMLARETHERQQAICELLFGEPAQAGLVADALAMLDGRRREGPKTPYERVSNVFAILPKREQFAFFTNHAELIDEWLARRAKGGEA